MSTFLHHELQQAVGAARHDICKPPMVCVLPKFDLILESCVYLQVCVGGTLATALYVAPDM